MSSNQDAGSRLVKAMREEGAKKNGYDLLVAKVISVVPIAINYNNTVISEGICVNQVLLDTALCERFPGVGIHPGENVLVKRVKDDFYILCKI